MTTDVTPENGQGSALHTDTRRRILIVTNRTGALTSRGGMSAFITRLAHELSINHDVTIASVPSPTAKRTTERRPGELFVRVEPRDLSEMDRHAREHDLVLVNQWYRLVTAPERTVLMLHGGIQHSYPDELATSAGRRQLRDTLARPAALAACSNWAAATVADFCGRDVATLYPPVDRSFFEVPALPKRPVAGFAGRVSAFKGADLIPVFAADPRLREVVVEMTNLTPDVEVEEAIIAANRAGIVHLVPPIHNTPAMARYLAGLSLALVPSRVEGFGLSAIEAQVAGTFVIASAVEGLHESVLPGGGVLVPTAADFVEAIRANWGAVPDAEVRRVAAERFSAAGSAQRLLSLL